jgi:hypothetical protein
MAVDGLASTVHEHDPAGARAVQLRDCFPDAGRGGLIFERDAADLDDERWMGELGHGCCS